MTSEAKPATRKLGVLATLGVLAGTVVFVTVFLALYTALGVGAPYIGLLFLLYWAAIRHQEPAAYWPSVAGGVVGLATAWLLIALPPRLGLPGSLVSYGVLGVVLFCFTRGQLRLVANHATLLFVLVAAIPELGVVRNIVAMIESLLLGAAFMGGVSLILRAVQRRLGSRSMPVDGA